MRSWSQRVVAALVALSGLPGPAWAVSSEVDILLNKLVEKGVLSSIEAGQIRDEITQTKEARTKEVAKEVVPKWAQQISLSGDLRLRTEHFQRDASTSNSSTRNRQRARLRVGLKAKVSDQLEAGVRLATGTDGDPVSTNQTAADIFDKKNIFLDQAYLKFTTTGTRLGAVPLTVWGGKFENPFYSTQLVWDSDLTFEGAAATLTPVIGPVEPFLAVGVFPVDELNPNGEDPTIWGVQAGTVWHLAPDAATEWAKALTVKGGLGYYDYKNLKHGIDTLSSNRFGNTAAEGSGAGTTVFAYDYNLLDLVGEINTKLLGKPVLLYSDYVKNTAIADNDEGFEMGLKVGKADKPLAWEAGYTFTRLEPDAVVGQFSNSDFGDGGTNRSGHAYYAAIGTLKNSTLGFKWSVTEAIDGTDLAIDRLQVDWNTKF